MESNIPARFWLLVDARSKVVLGDFDSAYSAEEAAKQHARDHIGDVVAVMQVHEAYTSSASVSRTFLEFPERGEEPAR